MNDRCEVVGLVFNQTIQTGPVDVAHVVVVDFRTIEAGVVERARFDGRLDDLAVVVAVAT